MAWMKVDEHVVGHPACLKAGNASMGLWVRAGAWMAMHRRQDSVIPGSIAKHLGSRREIAGLLDAGLWIEFDGDYLMRDTMDIAPSRLDGVFWEIERTDLRRPIPQQLRLAIYERDNFACVECGTPDDLSLDHIHPWSKGGTDTYDNLRTLCRSCNSRKGARV